MESSEGKTANMSKFDDVSTKQGRIAKLAKEAPDMAMNLSHHMDLSWFIQAYHKTRKDGAVGVDGQTARDYARRSSWRISKICWTGPNLETTVLLL